jgi:hypothetical protein
MISSSWLPGADSYAGCNPGVNSFDRSKLDYFGCRGPGIEDF